MGFLPAALHSHKPHHLLPTYKVALRGQNILSSPRFNKGVGFPINEREAFGLIGRLPYRVNTLHEQCERAYGQLMTRDTPLRKNTFLQSLKEQNWVLYFALLSRHLKELVPVIYTPTQGDAIANYSHLFRRSEGLFLTLANVDTMEEDFLEQTRGRDIDLVVCTDSEAILGIGDQGVGGIGISTAKSVMYTLIGGLDPSRSLSVMLDVGTANEELLNDDLYVGWPHKRVRGEEYDKFIDKFVQLVRKYHPHSLLHFEDFGVTNAHRLLMQYRYHHAAFNDDIQGTGAVTLACIMAAIGVSSRSSRTTPKGGAQSARLADQKYVILGAGSAGMGIAVQLRDAMIAADSVSREEANKRFWLVDRDGLLFEATSKEGDKEDEAMHSWDKSKREFVRPFEEKWGGHISLLDVVKKVKPTVLIGCSTAAGAFTEEVVKTMDKNMEGGAKPIIMPLSNPSRLVEAIPADIMKWTEGRALVATGSPFGSVKMNVAGKEKVFNIAECNNALIYPGLGFGAILCQSRQMTDTMLIAGAKRLAALSPAIQSTSSHSKPSEPDSDDGTSADSEQDGAPTTEFREYNGEALLPDFDDAPRVNFEIAIAVAEQAVAEGSAQAAWAIHRGGSGEDLAKSEVREMALAEVRERAQEKVWVPLYPELVYDEDGLRE